MVHNPPTKEHRKKQRTVTLILAPLALCAFGVATRRRDSWTAAVHQWEQEIIDKCDKGAFDICIYHGASKPKKIAQLQEYDIILTTHASLALEWQPDDGMAKAKAKRADKKKGIEWDSDTEVSPSVFRLRALIAGERPTGNPRRSTASYSRWSTTA
jgi:hypothetical protein